MMEGVTTTLEDVQTHLLKLVDKQAILVGHRCLLKSGRKYIAFRFLSDDIRQIKSSPSTSLIVIE